jgi:transcriptional regulator with XRE-family HTH domain
MNLAKRIRDLRYAKGWGPDELASRAKISRTALYQIERGNTSKPQAGTLRRISRALGVPLEVLLDSTPMLGDQGEVEPTAPAPAFAASPYAVERSFASDRGEELMEKFRLLLASPMADGIARIVEESFRLLPIIPPPVQSQASHYMAAMDVEPLRTRTKARAPQPTSEPATTSTSDDEE